MSVFVRTSKNSGVSVPWVLAPFLLLGVMAYWLVWLVVMAFVVGVRVSVKAVVWAYAQLSNLRPGPDA